ncbi:MAG TPA: tRNA (adenosine(37)-N6)-threonylcarbamoyltransferase complex dimerization subunit type 1 TsaB [Vitreimonas sp.]|nr:tRNA (adenosine(37)-N6)-threonylcarbamoyltransferase complex dimerization subunit type 1 TsaB [Vitreimonas sp.]
MSDAAAEERILAIDTATSHVVVALGGSGRAPDALSMWPAGHRHGEQLLPSIGRVLEAAGVDRTRLRGIVVGTGPGAFTGLRVGLATAKALAHGLRQPLAGVATSDALIAAAVRAGPVPEGRIVLLLPAGPSDRVVVRAGAPPRILPAGTDPELETGDVVVAVDLDGRAGDDALARGARARESLGAELLRLGAARLAGGGDDPARLVPEYVTLPRGVAAPVGEVSWSRDHR